MAYLAQITFYIVNATGTYFLIELINHRLVAWIQYGNVMGLEVVYATIPQGLYKVIAP